MKTQTRNTLGSTDIHKKLRPNGFTLLEALIALAVFSVGLLVIAQFQGSLMKASGQSKAASEALYLAQSTIDRLRTKEWGDENNEEDSISSLLRESEDVWREDSRTGTSDEFTIQWRAGRLSDDRALITVRVLGSEIDTVQLTTAISRSSTRNLLQIDGDGILNPDDADTADSSEPSTVDGFELGTLSDGSVLIRTPEGPAGEPAESLQLPNRFGARISGTIFLHESIFQESEDDEVDGTRLLQVNATGNSLCRKFPIPSTSQFSTDGVGAIHFDNYRAVGYSCIVSNGWLGSISVSASKPNKVCVGSPWANENDENNINAFSNGPGVPTERRYFGTREDDGDTIETGISGGLIQPNGDIEYEASIGSVCGVDSPCESSPMRMFVPGGHHFLVSREDKACDEAMLAFSEESIGHSSLENEADSRFNPNNPFYDNPAGLVCTTGICFAVTETATDFRTRMSGFVSVDEVLPNSDVQFLGGSLPCQSFGFGNDDFAVEGSAKGAYWCPVREPFRDVVSNQSEGTVQVSSDVVRSAIEGWAYQITRDDPSFALVGKKLAAESIGDLESDDVSEWVLDFTDFDFILERK